MNKLRIDLQTEYESLPSHCKITCCGLTIYDDLVTKDTSIDQDIGEFQTFVIEIEKTGKSMELVKKSHKQNLTIKKIQLNGIDLKTAEFGQFSITGNPYVDDHTIQTDRLDLNGVWRLELPRLVLRGSVRPSESLLLRDTFGDCDVACFGCSQTYGYSLEPHETWPNQLQLLTGRSVRNFGTPSSSINEITALVEKFLESHHADTIILYLPHTFRRQTIRDGRLEVVFPDDPENRDLILHGEEHSVALLAGHFVDWIESIAKGRKVFFGTYHIDEHKLFERTPACRYLLPFFSAEGYPPAPDGQHFGAKFSQDLAKNFIDFLQIG